MRITTRAYDRLARKEMGLGSSGAGWGDSGPVGSPSNGGDMATQSLLSGYLQEFDAEQARSWRDKNIWADIAIKRRMDAVRDQDRRVGAKDPKLPVDQALVAEITQVLEEPNAALESNTFGGVWGAGADDMYTLGHGTIQALLNRNRTPRGFRPLNSARMRQDPHWDPNHPFRVKRWIFQEGTQKEIHFDTDEIIRLVPYMSTHARTGQSPMKALQAILQAELDTRRGMHLVQKFRTPPGVFIMPGAAPGSPEKMRLMYDLKMAGRATIGFMNLPRDSKFVEFGGINLITQGTFQFYEILVRATAASFATTPFALGWTDSDNRANSISQMSITDRGESAMLKFLREIINGTIISMYRRAYGSKADNIWWSWLALLEEDEIEDAQSLRTKMGPVGYIAINEVRTAGGLTEYQEADVGAARWPFFSEPWVPSRIPGVMLPLTYAMMTWGVLPDMNIEEIGEIFTALSGVSIQDDGEVVEQPTTESTSDERPPVKRHLNGRRLKSAYHLLTSGEDPKAAIRLIQGELSNAVEASHVS